MANKVLNARFQMKYDTLENWTENATMVPLKGEVCVVEVPSGRVDGAAGTTPPAILFKVGDGEKAFSALPYITALAGDVYSWAKASTKPAYSANEINGLEAYIGEKIQDTDTQYKILKVDETTYKLQSKDKDGETYSDVEGSEIDLTPFVKSEDFESFQTTNTAAITDAKKAGTDATAALNSYKTTNDAAVKKAQGAAEAAQATADAAETSAHATATYETKTDATAKLTEAKSYTDAEIEKVKGSITGALHFVGTSTTDPKGETGAAVVGHSTWAKGDVVIFGSKEYVLSDDANEAENWVELGDEGSYLLKSGGTMTGVLTLSGAPTADLHAATKAYVDSTVTTKIGALDATKVGGGANEYIDSITQTDGKIVATKKILPAAPEALPNPEALTVGAKSYDGSEAVTVTFADLASITGGAAIANQVVSAVTETGGKITVTHRALAEADIPTIPSTKVTGLATVATSGKIDDLTQTNCLVFYAGTSSELV